MKRYIVDCMDEDPNGEVVLWDDVVPFLQQTEDAVKSNVKIIRERDELLEVLKEGCVTDITLCAFVSNVLSRL